MDQTALVDQCESSMQDTELLEEQLRGVSSISSIHPEEMDQTVLVNQCESSMQDTELLAEPRIDISATAHENSPSIAPEYRDQRSAGNITDIDEGEGCDKKGYSDCSSTAEPLGGSETSQQIHFENSEDDTSKVLADNGEDQKPPPSLDSGIDDAVMIIDVDDEPHTSAVAPQESYMDFKSIPFQITGVWKEFEHATQNNFTKGCKWSPDGSCILSCSEDAKMRLFNLPMDQYQTPINWADVSEMTSSCKYAVFSLESRGIQSSILVIVVAVQGSVYPELLMQEFSVLKVSEAELIYDYCWYPLMSSMDPISCCFVSSSRCNPVHMWDAFTGELRCTYRSYNHLDEIVATHGLAFDSDGQKLYCGFKNMIRIFNVSIPGRNFRELPTCVKKYGQKGIISSFAFSAENRSVFAAGSYSKTVGIYSETDGTLLHLLDQQKGGVTHMCFSPDGCQLYCGGRNDPEIQCWDMRNMKKPLFQLRRICNTNQRMYFDISRCGQYIASGNNNGVVTIWDVKQPSKQVHLGENVILEPLQFYQAHNDCVNGISFHPNLPLLATSSGQRQFPELLDSEGEESDGAIFTDKHTVKDNSIRLWWTGPSQQH